MYPKNVGDVFSATESKEGRGNLCDGLNPCFDAELFPPCRYNLEASGRLVSFSNPSGKLRSTYQVLTELCRRHVAVRSEAETEKKAADEIEERIRQKMESFSQQLEQVSQ